MGISRYTGTRVVDLCIWHATQTIVAVWHTHNDYLYVQQVVLMTYVPTLSTFIYGAPKAVGYRSLIGMMS